ncbi:hypothetical protein K2173_015639 [Erythroxylum novogranatense]|uniref:T-complex protein 1 subunit gamma n=1 Tax=Erythroxylum novogranatense TaxID=1862640 RepID=A0AAV8SEN6_9ROSI|nr:hypothetical protein K2173_015639 [Erythroxylum novogranatense]
MHAPVLVLKDSLKRESGTKVHHANIQAAKAVADIIRTTLGPRSMLKMLLDTGGGIVVTNDGNSILQDLDLAHPAAKSMIELSRTQDEEVGDGTTSVIVLAGEMLHVAEAFIDKNYHPTVICRGATMLGLVKSCIGTKFTSQFGDLIADPAIDATTTVGVDLGQGLREVDIKNYIKVEKVPGGQLEDSKVLKGVMFNKDVVAPGVYDPLDDKLFTRRDRSQLRRRKRNARSVSVIGKSSFVEHRTFLHPFRSFHRLWIFLVLMFQALTIIAFQPWVY